MDSKLIAKVTDRGVVWTSVAVGFNRYAYQMERARSTRRDYSVIEEIVVYPGSGGWEVRLYGDPVSTRIRYKSDAQRQAEELLDNNRDSYGYFLKTTGLA